MRIAAVRRLRFIRRAQQLGFSLEEIRELLELRACAGPAAARVKARTQAELEELEAKNADLEAMRSALRNLHRACCEGGTKSACPTLDALDSCELRRAPRSTNLGAGAVRIFGMCGSLSRPWGWLSALAVCVAAAYAVGCFPLKAGPRLAHSDESAPEPGTDLPEVIVHDAEGREMRLADAIGERPVVLQLGSRSCPVFRYRRFGMQKLQREFSDRVDFLVLYTLEAHPVGAPSPFTEEEWDMWINRLSGVRLQPTGSLEERQERAVDTLERLDLDAAVLVDGMDDAGWRAFGAALSPEFVLDADGRVVLRQVWVHPEGIRQALNGLLASPEPLD